MRIIIITGVTVLLISLYGSAVTGNAATGYTLRLPIVSKALPAPNPKAFGYGISVADLSDMPQVKQMGFGYVKGYISWERSEPQPGQYQWVTAPNGNDANNLANAASGSGLKLIVRVDTPPSWAKSGSGNAPPNNPADFGRFMGALAGYLKGRVYAYEIWNEPNLSVEWGGMYPDPARYASLLAAAYPRIKAADPSALVVSAGLATTGSNGPTWMDDVSFINQMYAAGAKAYFDVLGSHPYGFASAPEGLNPNGILDFRRAEAQHLAMVNNGDANKPIWATEYGWLLDSTCDWPDRNWEKVSEQTQADYLTRSFSYAYQNWHWMGVMIVFNLDSASVSWLNQCSPDRWYSVTNQVKSPRLAYTALVRMPKVAR